MCVQGGRRVLLIVPSAISLPNPITALFCPGPRPCPSPGPCAVAEFSPEGFISLQSEVSTAATFEWYLVMVIMNKLRILKKYSVEKVVRVYGVYNIHIILRSIHIKIK